MPAAIHVDPERGEVRIGGATFDCIAAPGGALVVGGLHVHPISLGERDRIVTLTDGVPGRARRVARLIGDAAMRSASGIAPDDQLRAAIEAVALHLAGAELPGALARTTLLVTRAMGGFGAAAAVPAAEADRLAERLAAALPSAAAGGDSPDDGGWTTISYEPASTVVEPEGPAATRDHLAAMLLARDHPVGDELAAVLLADERPPGGEHVAIEEHVATPAAPPVTPADGSGDPWPRAATAATGRWVRAAPTPRPAEAGAGRWGPTDHDRRTGGDLRPSARTDGGTRSAGRRSPRRDQGDPSTATGRAPVAPSPAVGHVPQHTVPAPPGVFLTWRQPETQPAGRPSSPPAVRPVSGPAAWGSPSGGTPTTADPGGNRSSDPGRAAAPPPALARRPARAMDPFDEAEGVPDADGAGSAGPARHGTRTDVDLDAVAAALHLAADLRGVR